MYSVVSRLDDGLLVAWLCFISFHVDFFFNKLWICPVSRSFCVFRYCRNVFVPSIDISLRRISFNDVRAAMADATVHSPAHHRIYLFSLQNRYKSMASRVDE